MSFRQVAKASAASADLLEIREKAFGPDHPAVSFALTNLAALCLSRLRRFNASLVLRDNRWDRPRPHSD